MQLKTKRVTIDNSDAAYATGDAVGAAFSVQVAAPDRSDHLKVHALYLIDSSDTDVTSYRLACFDSEPAGVSDNAAFAIATADLGFFQAMFSLVKSFAGDLTNAFVFTNLGTNSVQTHFGPQVVKTDKDGKLWFQLEVTGTPTYSAASALELLIQYES